MKKEKKIDKIIKIVNNLMKKGCSRFEPDVCDACKKAKKQIEAILTH